MKESTINTKMIHRIYGVTNVSLRVMERYGYALLIIAGSDGHVTSGEFNWLIQDYCKLLGIPQQIIERLKGFDFRNGKLDEILTGIHFGGKVSTKKLLLYDAIRMSYADGDFAYKEKKAVLKAAKLLGVNETTADFIEALVEMERTAAKMRKSLFSVADSGLQTANGPLNGLPSDGAQEFNPFFKYSLGIEKVPLEILKTYCFALLMVAGADGVVSQAEEDWLFNRFLTQINLPDQIYDALFNFDFKTASLEEVFKRFPQQSHINFKQAVLYNCIQISIADRDFSDREREAVWSAAKILEVPEEDLMLIERLVQTDEAIVSMRKAIFWGK